MQFQPGQKVFVEATVMHVYHADREEAWQTLGLQLAGDGQSLQTNVRNCRPAEPEEDEAEGEKMKRPVKDKSKRPAQNKGLSHSSFQAAAQAPSAEHAPRSTPRAAEQDEE